MNGRRVAAPDASRGRARLLALAACVAPLVVGVAAVTLPPQPVASNDPAASESQMVEQVTLVCPDGAGPVRVGRADLGAAQPARSGEAPDLGVLVGAGGRSRVVEVAGTAAIGLFAEAGQTRGGALAVAPCRTAAAEWWLPGAGASVEHRSTVQLTNPDVAPAVLDVRLHGPAGPVPADDLRGLTVAPGVTRTLALDDLVPGNAELTVHVRAIRGRVTAYVRDAHEAALPEWLVPAAPPRTRQVLPVAHAGRGRTELLVTNPGDTVARVAVRMLGPEGPFVAVGVEELAVDPGAVAVLDVSSALRDGPASVEISSATPVSGALRLRPARTRDLAIAPALTELESPAVAVAGPGDTTVHLADAGEGGRVQARAYGSRGRLLGEEQLEVGPQASLTWSPPPGTAYVVLVPSSGQVTAGVLRGTRRAGFAVVDLVPLPFERAVPAVRPQPWS